MGRDGKLECMKTRITFILNLFLAYILAFMLAKAVFLIYNCVSHPVAFSDVLDILWHGLPLDASSSGYLIAVPLLLTIVSVWTPRLGWWRPLILCYTGLTSWLLAIIVTVDCALYPFWGFKLDATVFAYLDSPANALSSVSWLFVLCGIVAVFLLFLLYRKLLRSVVPSTLCPPFHYHMSTCVLLLMGGLTFLVIRGGTGKSTMNVGVVYYSTDPYLNHAAVNPAFSLLSSSLKSKKFDKMYRFFPEDKATTAFDSLGYSSVSEGQDTLLTTLRPNILLIIMEGFGGTVTESLGGRDDISPCFSRLVKEGVFFNRCYANSYRTDRGTVCILSGYPSFPTVSPMKMPGKSSSLGSIASVLKSEGYSTDFLYGGDINFTNMKSYLLANGYQQAIGDTWFPSDVRKTHAWGVTDHIVFDSLLARIIRQPSERPWFTTCLTLPSHEPWEVPFSRKGLDKKANAMAYLDDCLGHFVEKVKQTPAWDSLLIICLPDHGINYPEGTTESDIRRYHIPMLWIGGAVKQPRVVSTICSQTDLVATLLGQLHMNHTNFPFSRDILSANYTCPHAIHTFDNGFAYMDTTGYTVVDLTSGQVLTDNPHPSSARLEKGKVLLQKMMEDFSQR